MKLCWHQEAPLGRQQMKNHICASESAEAIGLARRVLFLPALQRIRSGRVIQPNYTVEVTVEFHKLLGDLNLPSLHPGKCNFPRHQLTNLFTESFLNAGESFAFPRKILLLHYVGSLNNHKSSTHAPANSPVYFLVKAVRPVDFIIVDFHI